jgi:hypothetical protein
MDLISRAYQDLLADKLCLTDKEAKLSKPKSDTDSGIDETTTAGVSVD